MTTTLAARVAAASDVVAQANHATFGGLLVVTDLYDVVGSLDELVGRLPQLVAHLARSLDRSSHDGVFDDRGHDPQVALADAGHALAAAQGSLDALGVHTRTAHNALGHLGRRYLED